MEWVLLGLVVVVVAALVVSSTRKRSLERARTAEELRQVSKVAEEDVTRFGEELQDLHVETLTTTIDPAMRQDYQRALDSYENAKALLGDVTVPDDVSEVTKALEDGRYAMACVLARQAGEELPQRRPPCFFNAAHGPAQTDIEWAPPGGVPREIPVCLADEERVRHGADPDTRTVRSGNRMVPWYEGGRAYAPYASGYYGGYAMNGLFPGFMLGAMLAGPGMFDTGAGEYGELGGGDMGGGDAGGGDMGGGDGGGFFGGGDGGGGFGGFDIGGF